jgi:hypothetical protein
VADLTNEEIAELRRLEREATPGPWRDEIDAIGHEPGREPWHITVVGTKETGRPYMETTDLVLSGADRAFIVAARNALPRLLDLAERSSPAREPGAPPHTCDPRDFRCAGCRHDASPPPAREPRLREAARALLASEFCRTAKGDPMVGAAEFAALRRALAGETRPDPLRRMADRFSDPSLRAAAHAGLDAGETREPGTPAADPGAALATALRLLASEHNVLRKVRLRETFTMEESQAASASWHEAEDFLAAPSPGEDAATTGVIPPEHANECSECHRTFDMRDLTQVMFHTTHQPTAVLNVAPGVRVDAGGAHNKAMRQDERPVVDVICPGCAAHVPSNDSHLLTCSGLGAPAAPSGVGDARKDGE